MKILSWILTFFWICFLRADADEDNAECLETCLTNLHQKAPALDAASVLSIGHIRSGNRTVVCPKYNEFVMNATCGSYEEAAECLERCPNGPIKVLSTSGFAPLQLICSSRSNDVRRYMPCISENCAAVEAACQPKCGAFDDISKDMLSLLMQIRGSSGPPTNPAPPSLDPTHVTQVIDNSCSSIECYAECSRSPTTNKCGEDAYNLEMEIIWTIFASMTQSMSSIGLTTPWPQSCKTLQSKFALRANTTNSVDQTPQPEPTIEPTADESTTKSNSIDQFVHKIKDITSVGTNATCQGAACGSSAAIAPSILLLIISTVGIVTIFK